MGLNPTCHSWTVKSWVTCSPLKRIHFRNYKIRVITKSISQVVVATTSMHRGAFHCHVEYRDGGWSISAVIIKTCSSNYSFKQPHSITDCGWPRIHPTNCWMFRMFPGSALLMRQWTTSSVFACSLTHVSVDQLPRGENKPKIRWAPRYCFTFTRNYEDAPILKPSLASSVTCL